MTTERIVFIGALAVLAILLIKKRQAAGGLMYVGGGYTPGQCDCSGQVI